MPGVGWGEAVVCLALVVVSWIASVADVGDGWRRGYSGDRVGIFR
jgi:hypothetical protein